MHNCRAKAFFIASLCLFSFGYGIATAHFRVFPFAILQNAYLAWCAVSADADDDSDRDVSDVRGLTKPAVRRLSSKAGNELILVSGGEGYLEEFSSGGHGCLAWIMDRQGRPLHVWHYDPEVWAQIEKVEVIAGKPQLAYPMGMWLYANGDLLVSFQGRNTFPYGMGLAKFDKDSKLLWKKEQLNHHWFTVAPDGRIFTPAMHPVESPCQVGQTRFALSSSDGKILRDVVQILDANGQLIDEIDVLEALIESELVGLLPLQTAALAGTDYGERFDIVANDPTHLNGVQIIDRKTAASHQWLQEGDLLLSMRNLNAVGIVDPYTKRFKWMSAGACIQQHSPRLYDDGVLVLDNRGGPVSTGGSRLVRIDLESRLPQTLFPQNSSPLPGGFYTSVAGQFELGDSDRALVAITMSQKIWEVNLRTGEVLWEYLCVDSSQHRRRSLSSAQYVREASFPFNRRPEQPAR
jgi:hypothetical protein